MPSRTPASIPNLEQLTNCRSGNVAAPAISTSAAGKPYASTNDWNCLDKSRPAPNRDEPDDDSSFRDILPLSKSPNTEGVGQGVVAAPNFVSM